MKNGLSYFNTGRAVGVVDEEPAEQTIALPTDAAAKKAPLNPTQTADLLANMQSMIEARQSPMALFNRGMERAAAWGSGGIQGPSAALNQLNQQQAAEEKSTFEMRQQMAAYRAAQEQQKAMNARWGLGGTGETGGTPTAGGTTQQQNSTLLSLVKDPSLRQQIRAQASIPGGEKSAMSQLNAYLADNAKDPDTIKTINRAVSEGWLDPKLVPSIALTKIAGASAFVPHDVRGVGGDTQSTPLNTAQRMSPVGSPAAPGAQPSAMRPGVAAPAPMQSSSISTPAPMQPSPVTAARPAAPVSAPVSAPAAPVASRPAMQAPLVAPTVQTGFDPGTKQDLEVKAEFAKQRIAQQGEQQKVIEKAAGESAIQLQSLATNAKNNILEYDIAENLLKKHPEAFGIAKDGSATAAVIQLIKPGVQIPILGVLKAENAEEALAQKRLSPSAIKARELFNAIAARQGVEFAKNNLTGEGRGTLSNADMLMARAAKGLEVGSPAATNLIFTILNRENEMMTLQRNNAYQKYVQDAKKSGRIPDFNEFRSTPEFQKASDDKVERIKKRFPEFFEAAIKSREYLGEDGPLPEQGVKIKKYNPKTGKPE
jgi:hypothetical protein